MTVKHGNKPLPLSPQTFLCFRRDSHGRIMAAAARLVEEGHLKPLLDSRRFPLAQLADAHRHLESGRAVGKVVVEIDPSIPR